MDDDNIVYLTDGEHGVLDRYLDSMDICGLKKDNPVLYNIAMASYRKTKDRIKERGRLIEVFEKQEL